jgi:hypothetical protein
MFSHVAQQLAGTVGASLVIFLGFTVSGSHLGFLTPSLQRAFASSAMFPVTVTAFSRGLGDKLCKYLTKPPTQIGAQGFEKLFPLSPQD